MSSPAASPVRGDPSPAGVFTSIVDAAVGVAAARLQRKVAGWADKLSGVAAGREPDSGLTALADQGLDRLAVDGGPSRKAAAEGVKAHLHGKNPLWAAVKGAWEAGTPVVRAAIIAGLAASILLLVLSPVPLLVFLLSMLILVVVQRARAGKR